MSPHPPLDGAAIPRRSPLGHPRLVHALGLLAAAVLGWLVWRGYRQPGFLIDLANAMFLC